MFDTFFSFRNRARRPPPISAQKADSAPRASRLRLRRSARQTRNRPNRAIMPRITQKICKSDRQCASPTKPCDTTRDDCVPKDTRASVLVQDAAVVGHRLQLAAAPRCGWGWGGSALPRGRRHLSWSGTAAMGLERQRFATRLRSKPRGAADQTACDSQSIQTEGIPQPPD